MLSFVAIKVTTTVLNSAPHPPGGSFVVSFNVTCPLAKSPTVGIYVAFNVVAFGENIPPDGDDHVPVVAFVIVPFNTTLPHDV